jgi:hypothetical protein
VRKKRLVGKWFWLLLFTALVIGIFVYLEWLGSEQQQTMLEQPVAVPISKVKTEQ